MTGGELTHWCDGCGGYMDALPAVRHMTNEWETMEFCHYRCWERWFIATGKTSRVDA